MYEANLGVRHLRDVFLKVFRCLKMHANILCGISEISETSLSLTSKTILELIRHLFTSFDTFQIKKQKKSSPTTFLTSLSKSEKQTKIFSTWNLNCESNFSSQAASLQLHGMSRMEHVLLVFEGHQGGTTAAGHYVLRSYGNPCMKPTLWGWLNRRWKSAAILVTRISWLRGLGVIHLSHSSERRASALQPWLLTASALAHTNPI